MEHTLTLLAATHAAEKKDIFSSLGIDWTLLAFQVVAFLLLVALLGKFVYPYLIKTLDERQDKIEAGVKAAQEAEKKAASAQAETAALLKEARKEANGIIATAKSEAAASIIAAEEKAKARAERITEQAHEQIQQDIVSARKTLRQDTIELVALATEKVVRATTTEKTDKKVIEKSLKEVK